MITGAQVPHHDVVDDLLGDAFGGFAHRELSVGLIPTETTGRASSKVIGDRHGRAVGSNYAGSIGSSS